MPFFLEACSREQRKTAADERAAWIGARKNLIDHAMRAPLVLAPSRLAGEAIASAETAEAPDAPGARGAASRDRALLFGQAFHRIMELADISGTRAASDLAAAAAAELGIGEEARELERCAASTLGSDIMRRAARAERLFREVPFVLHIGGHFIEGRIDLLFEESGQWTLVDYKTDDPAKGGTGDRLEVHRLQAGLYARALEQFGMACSGVELYFARSNTITTIEYSSGLKKETERLIREAGITRAGGRAPSRGNRLEA